MKGFIQRLALLIHWIAFGSVIYGVLAFLFRIVGKEPYTLEKIEAARGLLADPELETNSAYLTEQRQAAIATAQRMQAEGAFDGLLFFSVQPLAAGLGFAVTLWILKWLISGNKSFFPWKR